MITTLMHPPHSCIKAIKRVCIVLVRNFNAGNDVVLGNDVIAQETAIGVLFWRTSV